MNERIQASLDGELPVEDLTPDERAARAALESAASALRADLDRRAPADMDAAVMRRIEQLGLEPLPARAEPVVRRAARALWTAREVRFRLRPVFGALAAAAVLAALLLGGRAVLSDDAPATVAVAPPPIYVQFRLDAASAHDVALAGSFSDWKPAYRLQPAGNGVWTVLLPLEPGVHDYGFIVDGEEWVPDPYAPKIDDGFGGVNSRLTVLAPTDL
ncbi:MAG TPA: glycogen-binding domain-containing protein [Longimicrobiales bacterium]